MDIRDERGFMHIYFMCLFAIGCVIIFGMMYATFAGVDKSAKAAYSWLAEAGDFAARTAVMQNMTSSSYQDVSEVETVFENSFGSVTQTNFSGNEFTPATGSPFTEPVAFNNFTQYSQGDQLPNGTTASADGYLISITVPVFVGTFPYIGQQNINIPMSYYAEL